MYDLSRDAMVPVTQSMVNHLVRAQIALHQQVFEAETVIKSVKARLEVFRNEWKVCLEQASPLLDAADAKRCIIRRSENV